MKKAKPKQPQFEIIYDPYRVNKDDTFDDLLQRYIEDGKKSIIKNEAVFFHSFQIIKTTVKGHHLIVALDNQMKLAIGNKVIDDHNNVYEVIGFEMVRFVTGTFPDWYTIISFVVLQGNAEKIGTYFSKQL